MNGDEEVLQIKWSEEMELVAILILFLFISDL